MIGLFIAIISVNLIAYKTIKRLKANHIVQIWTFTIAFEVIFDLIIEFKYYAYWYFDKEVNWIGLLPRTILIPPVNLLFLNWFPFKANKGKQILFIIFCTICILIYELLALLPSPWGYFHYGWWKLWYSAIVDPLLLLVLLGFYRWICKLEEKNYS